MRILVVGVGLALVASAATAQNNLRPFDFMGFVAGAEAPDAMLKRCRRNGADAECTVYPTQISNIRVGYQVKLHNAKLSSVYVEASPRSYDEMMAALGAKYGQPCKAEETEWSNAMGAKIANPLTTWCFISGKLIVAKYGKTLDHMLIFYQDENKAPVPAPTINF